MELGDADRGAGWLSPEAGLEAEKGSTVDALCELLTGAEAATAGNLKNGSMSTACWESLSCQSRATSSKGNLLSVLFSLQEMWING